MTKWARAWEDGFFTASALYTRKGLKPRANAQIKAYAANTRGRLTGLYHYKDAVAVKRHPGRRKKEKLPRIARRRKPAHSTHSQVSEALLAKIREVGEYLEQQESENHK